MSVRAPVTGAARLSRTVLALGFVSFLTDASSDMIWPLLPVFLVEHLHRSIAYVGIIEGIAEATAAVGKFLAGRYSDRVARKKPLVLLGYSISSVARPLLALATSPWHALLVRFADRIGKGARTAPRDALIAMNSEGSHRAAAFGFHRAMDNAGAVVGPLLAMAILWWRPGDLRMVFALAAIPGALAVLAVVTMVRERVETSPSTPVIAPSVGPPAPLSAGLRKYLAIVAIFTLGNSSDFFLITKARDVGVPLWAIPLAWSALSVLRAAMAVPGGAIADRIGRTRALSLGWGLYAVVYASLAFARSTGVLLACLILYGVYYGLTEGAERALVASLAPRESLGRAYGLFALVVGFASIPASIVFGALYSLGNGRVSFLMAAALALLASILLAAMRTIDVPGETAASGPLSSPSPPRDIR